MTKPDTTRPREPDPLLAEFLDDAELAPAVPSDPDGAVAEFLAASATETRISLDTDLTQHIQSNPQVDRARLFRQTLLALTPRVYATPTLVIANVVIYLLMVACGVDGFMPSVLDLRVWGGNFGPLTLDGQWWRFSTCTFIHIGFVHLLFNMWALWEFGRTFERMAGSGGMLVTYAASGVAGSMASVYSHPLVTSVGASGAIFGIAGALLGFLLRQRDIPPAALKGFRASGLSFVGYNILFSLTDKHIDLAAHLGGLVGGFVCGLLLNQPLTLEALAGRKRRNLRLAVTAVAVLGAIPIFGPAAPPDYGLAGRRFQESESLALDRFNDALPRYMADEEPADVLLGVLDTAVIPAWNTVHEQADILVRAPSGIAPPDAVKFMEYVTVRENFFRSVAEALREENSVKFVAAMLLKARGDQLAKELVPK